jgi:FtsH-binding integral membrane protein
MGTISAFYKIESVFIAVGITAFVCLGVTLFSCQTKYDFTLYLGILVCVSWALLGFGIVCIFTYSRVIIENNDI